MKRGRIFFKRMGKGKEMKEIKRKMGMGYEVLKNWLNMVITLVFIYFFLFDI